MCAHRPYRQRAFAFGNQLVALRTRAALTQGALAEQVGVHLRSVQNWEAGESYPKADALMRLIAALLLRRAFAPGSERAEAMALWDLAAQDGPRMRAAFDERWFADLLARSGAAATERGDAAGVPPPPDSAAGPRHAPGAVIDWGEAPAVPPLYGRDDELAILQRWAADESARVVGLIGLGGIGKSTLALALAASLQPQFDVVMFRSVQNGPGLGEVLDQILRAVSHEALPEPLAEKIARLVEIFRERRCLLILDNFESIMQPGAPSGTYRPGYAEYGDLLRALGARKHRSCLVLTSREKPAEIALLEGLAGPVRTLPLAGLASAACRSLLEAKAVAGPAEHLEALARIYGGNPLALQLVAEPIRELFGGDVGAFLAAGTLFFNGVDMLLEQQYARSTPLEQRILSCLAVERERVPLAELMARLGEVAAQRDMLAALESLRRRMLIERAPEQPAIALQPVILEFLTARLVQTVCQSLADGRPDALVSQALVRATASDYVRRSQERLIAGPIIEQLVALFGGDALELRLHALLDGWRARPAGEQGYGPGNVINLLRLLRGHLRGLDLSGLAIRQAYLQAVAMQDASLRGAAISDSLFTDTFDVIQAVAVSASGEHWAAASRRGEVLVWRAGDQALHRMWRPHIDMVWSICFSSDGRRLASCSWDSTVQVFDVATGAAIWSAHHVSHVNSVAFAPGGATLASAGNDGTIRLWDAADGALLQVLEHSGPVCGAGVTWSADGRLLAGGDLEGAIWVWEVPERGPARHVRTIHAHTAIVDGLAFAPGGGALASTSWDGTVKIWDAPSGRQLHELVGHTGRTGRVAWSPDGRTLAVSGYDPTIWLWDVAQAAYRATLHGHTDGVCGLAFTPDSRRLLSCGNGALRVWDAQSGQSIRVMQGYEDTVSAIDWSPDGARLVTGSLDGTVAVWDADGRAAPRVLHGHSRSVCGVGWSGDGRMLASAEWENSIRLWDAATGAWMQTIEHPDDSGSFFYGLVWSPGGQRLACGTSRSGVLVWDVALRRAAWPMPPLPTFVRRVTWSPDGARLAGGGDDGAVYIWDAADGALLHRLAAHRSMVTSVAWSADGRWLASGGKGTAGGELFVWDARSMEPIGAMADDVGNVYVLAWQPGAATLVSGDGDGKLRWWDVLRGRCVRTQAAHRGTVQSLRSSPDGARLASCGDDGMIVLWDIRTGERLGSMRRDRPYERMDIAGLTGISELQRALLLTLGAADAPGAAGADQIMR